MLVQFLMHLLRWCLMQFVAKPMIEWMIIRPLSRLLLDDGDSDGVMIGEVVEADIEDMAGVGAEIEEMG